MSLTNRFGLVAGTTALAIAGSAFGGAESNNDALSQIAELKQELAQLKQENSQDWLTEQRSAEIRGIVQDVLADADTRTSLQSSGAMAGYNNGFFLASPDGNFSLKVGGQVQVRWTMNSAKDQNTDWGFENRRTKLDFSGNVFSKDWTYRVRAAFNQGTSDSSTTADTNANGAAAIDFAYIEKAMDNGMSIRVGQFNAPWMREVIVDSAYQLAAERSVLAQLFGQGYSQGVQFTYAMDNMRFMGGAFDGIGGQSSYNTSQYNSQNTNWDATTTNYAFAGRADFKISGDWSQFDDFSSFKGEEAGMMAGVAVAYERGNWNAGANNGVKEFGITGDFTWDFGGASLFASAVWVNTDNPNVDDTANPWGVSVQGGYFVTEEAELFARYEYINFDTPGGGDTSKYNGLTFGANYFFAKGVKATVDFTYNLKSLSGDSASAALNGAGLRQDINGEDGQWALRAQLQLLF
jgi:phosphate-selective porin OprO and OprP